MKLEFISRHPENRTRTTPLLFVHGAFMGAWVWAEYVLPYMAQHGYEAHAVSFRGHGQSEGRVRLSRFGLDDYVEDIEQAVGKIGSSRLNLEDDRGGSPWNSVRAHTYAQKEVNEPPSTNARSLGRGMLNP